MAAPLSVVPTSKPVPSPKGLEHLLTMNQAATYTNAAVWELAERYGEVFVFGFGPIRFFWLVGPDALQFILKDRADAFTLKKAYSFLQPIGGDTALITSDEPEHLQRRRLVQPAFHGERISYWSEQFAKRTGTFLEGLETEGEVDFYARIRPHILGAITELLLGRATLERYPTLLDEIAHMMDFANLPFLAQQFKLDLPYFPWQRFKRARAAVDKMLYAEIARRRGAAETGDDILGLLLNSSMSDVELRDQAVSLVSAGFDTTSAALSWALYGLLEHPPTLERLRDELAPLKGPSAFLGAPYLDAVVKETLRLYPAAPAGLRQTKQELTYRGYLLPKDSLVAYSIYVTQRQEASFDKALHFVPERWLGGFKPAPFSYAPFGYGARYCIGAGLATMLIKTTLAQLVKDYRLEPRWQGKIEETGNTVHPKGGLPIHLSARA